MCKILKSAPPVSKIEEHGFEFQLQSSWVILIFQNSKFIQNNLPVLK